MDERQVPHSALKLRPFQWASDWNRRRALALPSPNPTCQACSVPCQVWTARGRGSDSLQLCNVVCEISE